ncbi:YrhA family protein [Bacillus sp. Cs-700]|uniref:YrhA family protein n=1 Tax=Bacillus sp. Cs-700 TaxID=2589818 RepID=UPI001A9548B4|nr:YrhA family protein [Bacillus sp. Cs-700]
MLNLLAEIEKIKNQDGKSIMSSANDENIKEIKKWISSNASKNPMINDYEAFLKKINGLEFNGLVIYNANQYDKNNGFIEANEIWQENEWEGNYLFFGDSNISWYCLDIDKHTFLELDKPSGDIVEEYSSFEEMLTEALKSVL